MITAAATTMLPVAAAFVGAAGLFGAWSVLVMRPDRSTASVVVTSTPAPATTPVPIVRAALAVPVVRVVRVVLPPHYEVDAPDADAVAAALSHRAVVADTASGTDTPVDDDAATDERVLRLVVRPGSFCTRVGAAAITTGGTDMVCESSGQGRPRWRRARADLQRSA